MKLKPSSLAVALLVALAAGAAQAQLSSPGSGTTAANAANGSLTFVAIDNVGAPISFAANLDYKLLDFLPSSVVNTAPQTIVWNFGNNSVTVNGNARAASSGNYQYGTVFSTFTAGAQAGDLQWGVFAADNNSNGTAGSTNLARRNLATTGAPTPTDLSNTTNAGLTTATGAVNTFTVGANASVSPNTIQSGIGAGTATTGAAFVGTDLRANFNDGLAFSYLSNNITSSPFTLLTGAGSGTVLGAVTPYGENSSFSFDFAANTLTWQVTAVPEPGSFAMMAAGLIAIGSIIRRRRSV